MTYVDFRLLHLKAKEFYTNGLAASTKSTYSAGQIRFTAFCKGMKVSSLATSETTIILFTFNLVTLNISYNTIKLRIVISC